MKKANGFTLIEVMIALAIFAITMSALMSAMNNSTRNLTGLQNRTMAQWIASNRMVGLLTDVENRRIKDSIEKIKFGGGDTPREWVIQIHVEQPKNAFFKIITISVGEEIDKENQYYATIDSVIAATK